MAIDRKLAPSLSQSVSDFHSDVVEPDTRSVVLNSVCAARCVFRSLADASHLEI